MIMLHEYIFFWFAISNKIQITYDKSLSPNFLKDHYSWLRLALSNLLVSYL